MQSMSSLPDTRQQSFDEIYGPPENFLEIEVRFFGSFPKLVFAFFLCFLVVMPIGCDVIVNQGNEGKPD